jgi:IclR family transcriptional regulator, KDG regulon repressor
MSAARSRSTAMRSGSTNSRPARTARRDPESRHVQSLLNAVDVLQAMARSDRELGVSELARRTGMSKAATYAILRTLETRRVVARDPDSFTYRLGWALYEMGASVVRGLDLSRVARTYLDDLARSTGDSVLLGIVEEDSILYLDRGESPEQFHMVANIGRRSPIHASASGRAILAFSEPLLERVLSEPLRPYTTYTVTDPMRLMKALERVRRKGYATCWQEVEIGLSSIGVPLRDYTGDVVAALTLAGPMARVNSKTEQDLVPLLRETAAAIEQRLGAQP